MISGAQGGSATIATEPFGASSSACPPQADIPPAPISGAGNASSPAGGVSLVGTRISTTRAGEAAVELRCASAPTCHGKLTLTVRTQGIFEKPGRSGKGGQRRSKTTLIGTASFTIPAGRTVTVELKLSAAGRALLGVDHGRLTASLTILKSVPVPSQTHSEKVQLMWQKHPGRDVTRG